MSAIFVFDEEQLTGEASGISHVKYADLTNNFDDNASIVAHLQATASFPYELRPELNLYVAFSDIDYDDTVGLGAVPSILKDAKLLKVQGRLIDEEESINRQLENIHVTGRYVYVWVEQFRLLGPPVGTNLAQFFLKLSVSIRPLVGAITGEATPPAVSNVLLNAQAANVTGAAVEVGNNRTLHTFSIRASSVTTGATVNLQQSPDNSNWHSVDSTVINANGNTTLVAQGSFRFIRATITARTDGTYTVTCVSK